MINIMVDCDTPHLKKNDIKPKPNVQIKSVWIYLLWLLKGSWNSALAAQRYLVAVSFSSDRKECDCYPVAYGLFT